MTKEKYLIILQCLLACPKGVTSLTKTTENVHVDGGSIPTYSYKQRQGLDVRNFKRILSSEVDNELFILESEKLQLDSTEHHDDNVQILWEMTTNFEWNRARAAEKEFHKLRQKRRNLRSMDTSKFSEFPYIVCNTNATITNGFERKADVQSYFNLPARDIYNRDDMTCFFVKSFASLASEAPSTFIVHPLTPSMKIQKGSIDTVVGNNSNNITEILEHTFDQYGLQVMLCPGAASTKSEGIERINSIIEGLKQHNMDGGVRRALTFSDNFFWTRSSATLAADEHRHIFSSHSRSLLWSSAISQGIDSQHRCSSMLNNLLVTASSGLDVAVTAKNGEDLGSSACQLSLVAGFASSPDVCVVTTIPVVESRNVESQWIIQSGIKDNLPLFDVGLTGRGQIVAVSDTGLDTDNCYFWDKSGDVSKDGSIDLTRRKVIQYVSFIDSTDNFSGHGTHIAGSIVGRRARNGIHESDGLADGIARDAKIAFYDMGSSITGRMSIPPNQADVFEDGRLAGAHLHSVSWGAPSNVYGPYDYQFDEYLFKNKDFMIFVAAGNDGANCSKPEGCKTYKDLSYDIRNTVFSPAVAKNVISVGASNNEKNSKPVWYLKGSDHIAYFSARGPTADGRSKPDIIAPGYSIISSGARPNMKGECDPESSQTFTSEALDSNPTVGLSMKYGTSMSAPIATGAAALIRQYFEEGWYPLGFKSINNARKPSGSLVKAVLLNGGREMYRVQNFLKYTSTEAYDQSQNFGMISLVDSLSIRGKNEFSTKIVDRRQIYNGVTHTYAFHIDNTSCDNRIELSATLIWVEPGATPGCMACTLNDLDLQINIGRHTYYPNGLQHKDSINNAERVRVGTRNGNDAVVSIIGHNIASQSQQYSLIVTGCFR